MVHICFRSDKRFHNNNPISLKGHLRSSMASDGAPWRRTGLRRVARLSGTGEGGNAGGEADRWGWKRRRRGGTTRNGQPSERRSRGTTGRGNAGHAQHRAATPQRRSRGTTGRGNAGTHNPERPPRSAEAAERRAAETRGTHNTERLTRRTEAGEGRGHGTLADNAREGQPAAQNWESDARRKRCPGVARRKGSVETTSRGSGTPGAERRLLSPAKRGPTRDAQLADGERQARGAELADGARVTRRAWLGN
jgi:hypothetical protein